MVERFDLSEGGFLGERGHMEADPTGDYVRYSDYADLERQIAELRAERNRLVEKGFDLISERDSAKAENVRMQSRLDDAHQDRGRWQSRAKTAEAENARLRALPLKDEVERADFWAVQSKTGMHIGLWSDRADADEAMRQYEGGTIMPLFKSSLLSRLRAGEQEGWQELRIAFEAAKYVPGDHPIVPVKIDTFMKTVERLLAAAPSEQGGDRG